jgi:hypothetical protein
MLSRGEVLSPTSFALSVHNAIGGQFSIIRGDTASVTAISNGQFTLEAAVFEAVTLLTEAPEVMVVAYDASAPPVYAPFFDEPDADFAFAWRVSAGRDFSLESTGAGAPTLDPVPHALGALRFFLSSEQAWSRADETIGWRWTRRHA